MTRILAAATNDSAANAVLGTANALADLLSATVDALHVSEEPSAAVTRATRVANVTLRTTGGDAVQELLHAAGDEDVAAVVIGARGTPTEKRGAGDTATALIAALPKPVVVVPPGAELRRPIRSVLVPLDGTKASAAALREIVELATSAEVSIVVAHVHKSQELPSFSDQLAHEVRAWREEFMARNYPAELDAALELRVGEPHAQILDITRRGGCDLVALGWNQDLSPGHAAVVREMLASSPIPVLLTPVGSHARITRTTASSQERSAAPSPPAAYRC